MATVQTPVFPLNKKPLHHLLLDPRLDEGLRVELMTIPPDLAAKWLKRNRINRPLQRRHVLVLARTIQSGAWDDANGETIIFGKEGELLDGQHRLTAVIEAQHSIMSLVVFGVDDARRGSIDTGAKRQLGDFLGMHGTKNAKAVASSAIVVAGYQRGLFQDRPRLASLFVNYAEAEAFVAAHPFLEEAVTISIGIRKLLRPAHGAALTYLFHEKDPVLTQHWIGTLRDGHMREHCASFFALRERMIRELTANKKISDIEKFAYNIKAWNAVRASRDLKVFKWAADEALPTIE